MNLQFNDKIEGRLYRDGTGVLFYRSNKQKEHINPVQKKERKFTIKKTRLRSSCLACWALKKSKYMLFITFTFPYMPTESEAQRTWKLLLDSMRNTYKVKNYVWVKEFQSSGRLHYHILVDRDRIGIKNLQNTWNNHINNVNRGVTVSANSVRLGNRPVVRSPKAVSGYLSKYISKTDTEFKLRAWGTSIDKNNIFKKIDVSDVILQSYEQKNSGDYHYIIKDGIKVLHESDCFIVFKVDNYFDISIYNFDNFT